MDDKGTDGGTADPVADLLRRYPFPPMQVVQQGWFRDTVTRRTADELMAEHRQREAEAAGRHRRS